MDPIDGHIVYATYLGGNGYDFGTELAVNNMGEVYVVGGTSSTDFPLEGGPVQSSPAGGFLAKLSADGSQLLYSSYIGNTCFTGSPWNCDVVNLSLGDNEDVYMLFGNFTGQRYGTAFKLTLGNSSYDYSYSLGNGTWNGIALDSKGNAYFAGYIDTIMAENEVAIVAITNNGTPIYTTPISFGGSSDDRAWGIAVDEEDYIYIVGDTKSVDFPTMGNSLTVRVPPDKTDLFVTIFAPDGTMQYSAVVDLLGVEELRKLLFI